MVSKNNPAHLEPLSCCRWEGKSLLSQRSGKKGVLGGAAGWKLNYGHSLTQDYIKFNPKSLKDRSARERSSSSEKHINGFNARNLKATLPTLLPHECATVQHTPSCTSTVLKFENTWLTVAKTFFKCFLIPNNNNKNNIEVYFLHSRPDLRWLIHWRDKMLGNIVKHCKLWPQTVESTLKQPEKGV